MPNVKFTAALERFFPNLKEEKVKGDNVAEVLNQLEIEYPGISDYIINEQGALRKHVNIFVEGALIKDKATLKDSLTENSEVLIFQALSGG